MSGPKLTLYNRHAESDSPFVKHAMWQFTRNIDMNIQRNIFYVNVDTKLVEPVYCEVKVHNNNCLL